MTQTGNELDAARGYEEQIVRFLRDLIAIPAESGKEGDRCERVRREYESLGFDEVFFDGLGSVVARIGSGDFKILYDGHIDCVGVGDLGNWDFDPFAGKFEDGEIWGRGAVDELPAIAGMAYGAKILADRGLPDGVSLYLTASRASALTSWCSANPPISGSTADSEAAWRPPSRPTGSPPTAPTPTAGSTRSTRWRRSSATLKSSTKISLMTNFSVKDRSSSPRSSARRRPSGKGSIIVSSIECTTPSLNAVPDSARIYIDRRLTVGETVESSMGELKGLPHLGDADVELLKYDAVSWRGARAQQEKYYPTWVLDEDHPLVQGVAAAAAEALGETPRISRWSFSTNGVATMGIFGIPTVGFAPGLEELAHTTQERVSVDDLIKATAVYSLIPEALVGTDIANTKAQRHEEVREE